MAGRTSSPPATWTIEEYTIGDLVSLRPYRGSFATLQPRSGEPITLALMKRRVDELLAHPEHPYTQQLLADLPRFAAAV